MRIRGSDFKSIHSLMLHLGAPRAVLRGDGHVEATDLSACMHARLKPVPPQRQREMVTRCMNDPTGEWVWVIGSAHDHDLVALLGLEFFGRFLRQHIAHPAQFSQPRWHSVYSGTHDRLRDDSRWRAEVGAMGCLVIDNVTTDAPWDKLEKVRDLLHMHEGIPRVVLTTGGDPLAFSMDRLHRRPQRVAFVNRSARRADFEV